MGWYSEARDRAGCSIGLSLPVLYSLRFGVRAIVADAPGVIKTKLSEMTTA